MPAGFCPRRVPTGFLYIFLARNPPICFLCPVPCPRAFDLPCRVVIAYPLFGSRGREIFPKRGVLLGGRNSHIGDSWTSGDIGDIGVGCDSERVGRSGTEARIRPEDPKEKPPDH
jgi:hypothetical protein